MDNVIMLRVVIGLVLLYSVWILFKKYLLDEFRQQLFELRNELFLYALKGNIEFSSIAYKKTRLYINSRIRFLHRVSFVDGVIQMLTLRNLKQEAQKARREFMKEIESVDQEGVAKHLVSVIEEADIVAIKYGLYTTPIVGIALFVYKLFRRLRIPSLKQRGQVRKEVRKLAEPILESQVKEDEITRLLVKIPSNGSRIKHLQLSH